MHVTVNIVDLMQHLFI